VPIYEYQCDECGALYEVFQKMSDDPLTECEKCGGPLRKVLHPVAIHFKGSGFYTTDYGKGSGRRAGGREGGPGETSSPGESSSGGDGESAAGDKKPSSGEGKAKETQKAT
jgi:putative FmdB family regulatory protein